MWLTQKINSKNSPYNNSNIYGGHNSDYSIVGESEVKQTSWIFPFGFKSVPRKKRELVFIKNKKDLCLGTVGKGNIDLQKGEVEIYNDFGAFIKLLSDGSVNINGLVIDKKGKIISP